MVPDRPVITCRTQQWIVDKLRYIADNSFRTINRELEMLVVQHIEAYEKEHGPIDDAKLAPPVPQAKKKP